MRSGVTGRRSRSLVGCSVVLFAAALFAEACTNVDTSTGSSRPATTSVAKASNPCAAKAVNPCAAKVANPCAAKAANPCNPCAAKAANPCAAKAANPCAAKNPCAAGGKVDPKLVTRPAGTKLFAGPQAQLLKEGERLWQNRTLGQSGLACGTCHLNNANFNATFVQPYPHRVAMPEERSGLTQVALDEMVQFCMVVPMASRPLAWESKELAALTAYAREVQKGFIKAAAANPCMLKQPATNPCNPCAAKAKNPCNPCGAKAVNPCAAKNPCAATNPCAAKNPCALKKQ